MNILQTILQNPAIISQLGQQFGLQGGQTSALLEQLVPVLARGLQNNTSQASGLEALENALNKGQHSQYFDNPGSVSQPATTDDGNGILGHIFGGKEVSRGLATRAEGNTGVSAALIKKMLPVVATIAMGALAKQRSGGASSNMAPSAQAGGGLGGLLGGFLDMDNDGSVADDLLKLAVKSVL